MNAVVPPSPTDPAQQDYIEVEVHYYDNHERVAFKQNYPREVSQKLDRLVSRPLLIKTADFLIFYLFHLLDRNLPGYTSVAEIEGNTQRAWHCIGPFVLFGNGSIRVPIDADVPNEFVEHLGEAIGLSVASAIHGLTAADWVKIPVKKHPLNRRLLPSFDFAQASDGRHIVQLETKGTRSVDNRYKEPSVSKHATSIKAKKDALQDTGDQVDPYPSDVRYGTITAIDDRAAGRVRCWLVDPPPDDPEISARDFKLLSRMAFLVRWISVISPQSQLSAALANRYQALLALRDPYELNNVRLRRGDGEEINFPRMTHNGEDFSSFFANKSKVSGGAAGGIGFKANDGQKLKTLGFVGIRQELLELAISQDFDEILSYTANSAIVDKKVEFTFSRTRYDELRLAAVPSVRALLVNNYHRFELEGPLFYGSSGLVFGWFEF